MKSTNRSESRIRIIHRRKSLPVTENSKVARECNIPAANKNSAVVSIDYMYCIHELRYVILCKIKILVCVVSELAEIAA